MKKPKISTLISSLLFLLLVIPKTRNILQITIQKGISKVVIPKTINKKNQETINNYSGNLKGINTPNIDFIDVKGNVVIINFWATWCPPCIAEMKSLHDLYIHYKNDVTFLFITGDSSVKTNTFLQKNHYTFPAYQIQTMLSKKLNHSSIPTTFLIDKNGKIIIQKTGAANWNSNYIHNTINNLLKQEL